MSSRLGAVGAVLFFLGAAASAQFVLKPVGVEGERLRPKTLLAQAHVEAGFAQVTMTYTFASPVSYQTEAEFFYVLPEGALATSFAYWKGDEKVPAKVSEKERAREIYRVITAPRSDPALVELQGKRKLRAKIFPVMPNADLKVEICWITPLGKTRTGEELLVPLKMTSSRLDSLKVEVHVELDAASQKLFNNYGAPQELTQQGHKIAWEGQGVRPAKDLIIGVATKEKVRVYAARAGGQDTFLAAFLPWGKGRATLSGARDVNQERTLGGLLVTGRVRGGQTTLRLGKASHSLSWQDHAEPGNWALKLWAGQQLAKLEKIPRRRQEAVSLSVSQGLLCSHTSWIAIPVQEREWFAFEIRRAKARVLGRQYVKAVGQKSAKAGPLLAELKKEAAFVKEDWETFVQEAGGELAWNLIEATVEDLAKGQDRRARGRLAEAQRVVRSLGLDDIDPNEAVLSWNENEQMQILYRAWVGEGLDSKAGRQATKVLGSAAKRLGMDWKTALARSLKARAEFEIWQKESAVFMQPSQLESALNWRRAMDRRAAAMGIKLRPEVPYSFSHSSSDALIREKLNQLKPGQKEALAAWRKYREEVGGIASERAVLEEGAGTHLWHEARLEVQRRGEDIVLPSEALAVNKKIFSFVSQAKAKELKAQAVTQMVESLARHLGEDILKGKTIPEAEVRFQSFIREAADELSIPSQDIEKILAGEGVTRPQDAAKTLVRNRAWSFAREESTVGGSRKALEESAQMLRQAEARAGMEPGSSLEQMDWPRLRFLRALRSGRASRDQIEDLARLALSDTKNTRTEEYNRLRREVLEKSVEMEEWVDGPSSPELEAKIKARQAEVAALRARMGDPLLSLRLPSGTMAALVVFPWGERAPLAFNPQTGEWERRFDIPPSAQPGQNQAEIVGVGLDGRPVQGSFRFVVDLEAPRIRRGEEEGRLVVTDLSGDIARVRFFPDGGEPVDLEPRAGGQWTGPASAGTKGRVIATDRAHNRTEAGALAAPASPVPTLQAESTAQLMKGHNIQALASWGEKVAAATLDEGLWIVEEGQATEVKGLPSTAPRSFALWGQDLLVRFGTGDLIRLRPDLTWESLNSFLPRRQAMAISSSKDELVVAQPGMLSFLKEGVWTHVKVEEEWKGSPVSALWLGEDRLLAGVQGRGLALLDRKTGAWTWSDERHGLTDDWVTATTPSLLGTFVGGALSKGESSWTQVPGTEGSHVTALSFGASGQWVASRQGLFLLEVGGTTKVASGAGDEIQAMGEGPQGLWVGTRKGLFLLRLPPRL